MPIPNLQQYEGKLGVLRFNDGHAVKARIVHVDPDDRNEVIYDVVEVVAQGRPEWAGVTPGTTASAVLTDVTDFQQLSSTA
jgi:hypothetical protein